MASPLIEAKPPAHANFGTTKLRISCCFITRAGAATAIRRSLRSTALQGQNH